MAWNSMRSLFVAVAGVGGLASCSMLIDLDESNPTRQHQGGQGGDGSSSGAAGDASHSQGAGAGRTAEAAGAELGGSPQEAAGAAGTGFGPSPQGSAGTAGAALGGFPEAGGGDGDSDSGGSPQVAGGHAGTESGGSAYLVGGAAGSATGGAGTDASGGTPGSGGSASGSGGVSGNAGTTPADVGGSAGAAGTSGAAGAANAAGRGGTAGAGGTSGSGGMSGTGGSGNSAGASQGGSSGVGGASTGGFCGDSIPQGQEECDEGPGNGDTAACTSQCNRATCGDGLPWTGHEACDDAGESVACNADCSVSACGDGTVNEAAGEICDAGAGNGLPNSCDASCLFVCDGACPLRVDAEVAAGGTGLTWASALNSLQAAVEQQSMANGGQVWVKTGRFTRSDGSVHVLEMRRGVDLYGGFAGTEVTLSQRDGAQRTTLDAEQGGTTVLGASNALLAGFIVMGGAADDVYTSWREVDGGGMMNVGLSSLAISDCEFRENTAWGCGGGMFNSDSQVEIVDSLFIDNDAERGAGLCNMQGSVATLNDTSFVANTLHPLELTQPSSTLRGGGLYNALAEVRMTGGFFASHPSYTDFENDSVSEGSALWIAGGPVRFYDVRFDSNSGGFGGAVTNTGTAEFVNCSFSRNGYSDVSGGAIIDDGAALIVNSTFADTNGPYDTHIVGNTATRIVNSVLWVPDYNGHTQEGVGEIRNSCDYYTSGSHGVDGPPRPFPDTLELDADGIPIYSLVQLDTNPCLDVGDNTAAEDAGLPWATLTTSPNGCLDSYTVDAGRHYASTASPPMACP